MKIISNNIVTQRTTIEPLSNKVDVSFEFFPPKTSQLEKSLWCSVERLAPLKPIFVSVTYGAGGSTREKTHKIVTQLQNKMEIPAAAHLTCVAASKAEVDMVARRYWEAGIRHIVALRGDPPGGQGKYVAHPEGYTNASDLVRGLKKIADFEISVATHPEGHPEAESIEADIENLKRKTQGMDGFEELLKVTSALRREQEEEAKAKGKRTRQEKRKQRKRKDGQGEGRSSRGFPGHACVRIPADTWGTTASINSK